jgi:hypothetical protein
VEYGEPSHLYCGPIKLADGRTVDDILYPRALAEGRTRTFRNSAIGATTSQACRVLLSRMRGACDMASPVHS